MAKNLVRKSALARELNRSPVTIANKCKPGQPFFKAVDKSTGQIDRNHKDVKDWIARREGKDSTKYYNEQTLSNKNKQNTGLDISDEDFQEMKVREILENYGSVPALHDYVKTRKVIVETELRIMQVAQARGELVSRAQTAAACFGMINVAFKRLLDIPQGSIGRIAGLLESGVPDAKVEAQELLISQISKILKGAKREVEELLNMKGHPK